jgi:hypothetical protein
MLAFFGDHFPYLVAGAGVLFMATLGYVSIAEALGERKGRRPNMPPQSPVGGR